MVEHAAVGHKVLFNRECKSHKAKVNRRVGGSKPSSGALSIVLYDVWSMLIKG